jgi:hypothetical protein
LPKTKTAVATLISALLLISLMFAILPISQVGAQTQYTNMQDGGSILLPSGVTPDHSLETDAHLSFNPNPVGVGQTVTVLMWLAPPTHVSRFFNDYKAIITDPDGNTETYTKQSYHADATSWMQFSPDKTGTWQIEFDFPGGYFPAGNYTVMPGAWIGGQVVNFQESVYYEPSHDGPYNLTVQEESVAAWPFSPLPTEYWTRPVSPENREWWNILGYFPSTGVVGEEGQFWPDETNTYMSNYRYVPYVQGPESAHVMWKRQGAIGGLIGGPLGDNSWTSGGGSPTIIYAGRCYQTVTKVVNGEPTSVWQCYDLRTGEIYWERTGVTQVPSLVTYNEGYPETPGGAPQFGRTVFLTYVGGGRLIHYDPYTGAVAQYGGFMGGGGPYNISIAPFSTGTFYANKDFPYFLSVQDLGAAAAPNRYRLVNWTVRGDVGSMLSIVNVGLRVMNNISWPFSSLSSSVDFEAGIAVSVSSPYNAGIGANIDANITAVSLTNGNVVWSVMADVPYNVWPSETVADQGKVAVRFENGYIYCWDLSTGQKLWTSEVSSWPWGVFGAYGISSYGGNIIVGQYDGIAAYDWDTGKPSWLYKAPAEYPLESSYEGSYPFFSGSPWIADGKVYYYNTEHTPTQPITRGWKLHCVNATTGEGIWSITGSMSPGAIADGYLVASNSYDGYMYVFGKGPSATTVTAPDTGIPFGTSIVIKGTVTDQSPAQKGTPCVSDDSMDAWMDYLHMQKSMPSNATGVEVTIDVVDANSNYRNIGTATSDLSGNFGLTWTPDIPGQYTVIATFAGSKSYGSSYSMTYFNVEEAPEAPSEPTPTPPSIADTYFMPMSIGVIVAIAVVAALLLLVLRKRP